MTPGFSFSGSALAQDGSALAQKLQTALDTTREAFNLVGISAALITPDNETHLAVSGFSDTKTSDTIEPEMLFCVYSITKAFMAALSLTLAEEGLISLDDTVSMWLDLPERLSTRINSEITIRQLLNHTSGIDDYATNPRTILSAALYPRKVWTPEELLDLVGMPHFSPGEKWKYSSTNYILVGMIIEEATGSTVTAELRKRIFEPLNLSRTFLRGEETLVGEVAHANLVTRNRAIDLSFFLTDELFTLVSTTGAIFSTAADIAKFANAHFGGKLLNEEYYEQMLTFIPDVKLSVDIRSFSYGLGIMRVEHERFGTVLLHPGGGYGYLAWSIYLPEKELAAAMLLNQLPQRVNDTVWHPIERILDLVISE
jgi:D-alanyl-D-alanine carboxypeptidase